MEAHKNHANKIACGLVFEGIYKASQVEVVQKKLTNDKLNDMNKRFGPYNDDCFNKTFFHEAIAVIDKRLESPI